MTDKPVYTMRECVELALMLVTAQIRDERISSIEELYGLKRHFEAALAETSPARIEALEAENARLREALEPFAALAHAEYDDVPNVVGVTLTFDNDEELGAMPFGCFRAARRAREGGNADG